MIFIDTHTHLSDEAYEGIEGQDAAVRRAIEAGVSLMIIPDVSSKERKGVMDLCSRWPDNCYPCLGLHPTDMGDNMEEEIEMLSQALETEFGADITGRHRVCAIGETGLDYHYGADTRQEQQEAFRAQIEMALAHDLPLIVHCREAVGDCLGILGEYKGRNLRGVFHAYSGSLETFRELQRLGDWYIGIGGVLTFKKAAIAGFVNEIPLERILLETDSPYLTPVPFRGQRNESANIPLIASFLADKMGISVEKVADVTLSNAKKLFHL